MRIQKTATGSLLVPTRIEMDGVVGDAMIEIAPDHEEYQKYLKEYEREQTLG
jgi:hypothetical protein